MNQPTKPRVIVITGAAAGVGRAAARLFARTEGAHIGLLARGIEALEGAKRDFESLGGKAIILQCDVADAEAVEAAAERVESEFGPIDVWVNDAMTSVFAFIKETTPAEFKTRHGGVLPRLRARNARCTQADASAQSWTRHSSGQRSRLARHPASGCLLREQARHPGLHGFPPGRTHPRSQPRRRHHGANARAQHTAVRVVQKQATAQIAARPTHFQPEIAAEAIVFASKNRRHEIYVGLPTVIAIIGNKLFPRLSDWYLGRTGVEGQQTPETADPNAPNNLFEPVGGDPGAHGTFAARSHHTSPQHWTDLHRNWLFAGVTTAVVALVGAVLRGQRRFR